MNDGCSGCVSLIIAGLIIWGLISFAGWIGGTVGIVVMVLLLL